MATQQSQLEVGFTVGNYQLVRLLGRGGMGDVWLASDLRADRLVALKFIKPHLLDTPEFRTRFLNEARTLGRLEHDRIVTLYNVVEDAGYLALVLRFIEGTTPGKGTSLADYIDERGALPIDFVLSSARDILPALGFAHERGVIHRDMKPQNILLDRHVRSFLTDFGIAVVEFAERGTVTGSAIGTPHYMSPEQIMDSRQITVQNKGSRSDIYSYGVVLYEMLTGRVPFCSDSGVEEVYKVQHAHCVEAPPPLRDVNPKVSPAIEDVVLRCLAKNPDDRPQTCADLLTQLEAAVALGPANAGAYAGSRREATVVEKSGPVARSQPAAEQSAKPPAQASSAGRRPVPKAAWLGGGALLIAAGISYGILTSTHGSPSVTAPPPSSTIQSPGPVDNNSKTGDRDKQTLFPETGSQTRKPKPVDTVRPPIGGSAAAGTNPANQLKAEGYYGQAADFNRKRMFCEGQLPIDEAVKLDPANPKYLNLQRSLTQACVDGQKSHQEAEGYFGQAELQFKQGDDCEGKSTIDKAVKLEPSNSKYLTLQESLRKGCNLP